MVATMEAWLTDLGKSEVETSENRGRCGTGVLSSLVEMTLYSVRWSTFRGRHGGIRGMTQGEMS